MDHHPVKTFFENTSPIRVENSYFELLIKLLGAVMYLLFGRWENIFADCKNNYFFEQLQKATRGFKFIM